MTTVSRERIVAVARDWLATPYRHQASVKGVGCDCLGLVRGVWRELYSAEPEAPPPYTPNWADKARAETLRDAAARHCRAIAISAAGPGDILLFRMGAGAPAKHAAILTGRRRVIHAYWGKAVVESALGPWWARRIAYAFAFPHVSD